MAGQNSPLRGLHDGFWHNKKLYLALFSLGRYAYRAWVTSLSLTPAGIWHFCEGRVPLERRIRELREDFALIPHPQLYGQHSVFGNHSFGVQLGDGFPENLRTRKLADLEP
jgi:hypothetical protein